MVKICSEVWSLLKNGVTEIEEDWRLKDLKYEKFGKEISATGAIKLLELAKKKKGEKYYLYGRFVRKDTIYSSIGDKTFDRYWIDKYHNIAIFTEVCILWYLYQSKYS